VNILIIIDKQYRVRLTIIFRIYRFVIVQIKVVRNSYTNYTEYIHWLNNLVGVIPLNLIMKT